MSGGTSAVEHIDAADAFARTLYIRAKQIPSSSFTGVAEVVRQLHLALRHLRVEASDPDSLLNSPDAHVYARQLRPIVEDCDFTLKQLETVLDKYGTGANYNGDAMDDRLAAVHSKLLSEKTNVDMFLDTVQLHNPANAAPEVVEGTEASLEGIKDKVDNIANKLFSRGRLGRRNEFSNGDDGLWQEFKAELEKEGFAPQVLRRHKDVLRAYIRELESAADRNGGAPPTVRGLLEYQQSQSATPPPVPPKLPPMPPKELVHPMDNEKYIPSMKAERRMPDHAPLLPPRPQEQNLSFERRSFSSEDSGYTANDSLALISTRDLMAMDSLNAGITVMNLQAPDQNFNPASPRNQPKYLASNMGSSYPGPGELVLSNSPNSQNLNVSPRFVPSMPAYTSGQNAPYGSSPRMASRLAPDPYGQEIPADAQWTKIKRSLVSPEVLQRAGVRYEARPEFVAILGHLSRDQVAEYARQSADCRAARSLRHPPPSRGYDNHRRDRADSKSSHDDEDDESVLWDESDTTDYDDDKTSEKGTRSYPYIVNAPDKSKTSPSSTVLPKPILKNKNENHVRFNPQPHEISPRSAKENREWEREHSSRRSRDHRDARDSSNRHRDGGRRDGDRHGNDQYRSSHRDRERRSERSMKKRAWGETLGAVGIGGAAVSLLGVLAEAAVGM